MSWDKAVEKVMHVAATMDRLDEELRSAGDRQWHFKKMAGYTKALFERFAPFKAGDRVHLAKTPDINPETSWGWMGSKHFLVKGAKGKVTSVDFDADTKKFTALVMFDDESWVPDNDYGPGKRKGVPVPIEEKDRHVYYFSEDWICKD